MWELKWCLAFIFMITVTAALHSPYNVMMDAVNTRYILTWDWDQTQANYTMEFTSEYTLSTENSYKTACNRTAEKHCDFSHRLDYHSRYELRVRAEGRRESSPWSLCRFSPVHQAPLGPPSGVAIRSREAMLTVIITESLTVNNMLMSSPLRLSYRVQYWEKHAPQRYSTLELQATQGTLTALKPWTDYCLRVCAFHLDYNKTSPYSSTQCVKTGGRDPHLGWYMLPLLCCLLLVTCLSFWHREKIRSLFLHPDLPSSIQDPRPSARRLLMEPREESCAALVLVAARVPQRPPEDWRAEQASATGRDSSGQDSSQKL
ncbi:interferon alpha/beta receptor 1a-like [Anguilla rostrata]|uniref:interferon alpha/beta receptor 1a-like n=1 Tax=Anguilla rostrata TaxID=7938 RepID=UPI0030CBD762